MNDKETLFLATSAEFQKILEEDQVLKDIEATKIDKSAELFTVLEMMHSSVFIGRIEVQPITPAVWSFLWVTGNNYAGDRKKITESDTDIFVYILRNGIRNLNCDISALPVKAAGYCSALGLDYPFAAAELLDLISKTFSPLSMLPGRQTAKDSLPVFDADWLTRIGSIAAEQSGESFYNVITNMALSTVLLFYVNKCRENDTKNLIHRRTPGEILAETHARIEQLGKEFLEKKNKD